MFTSILTWLQAMLTPVIGLCTLYIAWQQWRGNKLKLRMDRYDRRLKIYRAVVKIIYIDFEVGDFGTKDIKCFKVECAEADFLFGLEIREYIDMIYNERIRIQDKVDLYFEENRTLDVKDFKNDFLVQEIYDKKIWFLNQQTFAREKFKPYLDLNK